VAIKFLRLNNNLSAKSLVNTYYDSSVKKLYQVNSDGTKGNEIKMGLPSLNFTTPLHTFSSGNLTYTATKDCYVFGVINASAACNLKINGLVVASVVLAGSDGRALSAENPMCIKISSGDVVVASRASNLYILEEL